MRVAKITLEDVRCALAQPKPGLAAQLRMATRPHRRPNEPAPGHAPRQGAVLLLLYWEQGQLYFVLTQRTYTVANHKGQISFPGGAWEAGDASLAETAIREAEEELGISLDDAELLGDLTSLYISPSNYRIYPYVAYVARRPEYHPCADEVAALLEAPLRGLLDPSWRRTETWCLRGEQVKVPFFLVNGHKVWGATVMVLSELATMLESVLEQDEGNA